MNPEPPIPAVLVIDDESQMRRFLRQDLEVNGYLVREAWTGKMGLAEMVRQPPDAVLLDLNLPDMDGLAVLKRLREWSNVPVIIVSVRENEQDKIEALDRGANDFVMKPYATGELLARLRAARRLTQALPNEPVLRAGPFEVDLVSQAVNYKGAPLQLTRREYALVKVFVRHAGKILTHRLILEAVWGRMHVEEFQYLRVYMRHLREKIEADPADPKLFITEPGVGYRLLAERES